MRIEETFSVNRSPEAVFDYMTDPANLASWQTSKTFVEQLTDGPLGLGAPGSRRPAAAALFARQDRFGDVGEDRRRNVGLLSLDAAVMRDPRSA